MKANPLINILLLLSTIGALLGLVACQQPTPEIALATQGMKNYLLANYDPELGLIRESPNANPQVYWLYSDNYLASLALREIEPEVAESITESVASYQFQHAERWHVLDGQVVPVDLFAFGTLPAVIGSKDGKEIRSELPNSLIYMPDWQEYADRLLLAAINASNQGKTKEAEAFFQEAQGMFDGLGFKDKAFQERGYYDTYKLALYLVAAGERDTPQKEQVINRLLSLQEKNPASKCYGGLYTEYDGDGKPFPYSDTNTETTSLALLALK